MAKAGFMAAVVTTSCMSESHFLESCVLPWPRPHSPEIISSEVNNVSLQMDGRWKLPSTAVGGHSPLTPNHPNLTCYREYTSVAQLERIQQLNNQTEMNRCSLSMSSTNQNSLHILNSRLLCQMGEQSVWAAARAVQGAP